MGKFGLPIESTASIFVGHDWLFSDNKFWYLYVCCKEIPLDLIFEYTVSPEWQENNLSKMYWYEEVELSINERNVHYDNALTIC